jgi:hypothetical protein
MISTVLGRVQTKAITYPLLGLVTLGFVWFGSVEYLWLFAITMVVGLILEAIWGIIVEYQPGWLTILFGLIEFLAVANLAIAFAVPMALTAATIYYVTAWCIIQLFLIYLMPVWRMCWNEHGGEIW